MGSARIENLRCSHDHHYHVPCRKAFVVMVRLLTQLKECNHDAKKRRCDSRSSSSEIEMILEVCVTRWKGTAGKRILNTGETLVFWGFTEENVSDSEGVVLVLRRQRTPK